MEISSQRIEMFDRIAESFSWALSHSRVSVESLGEFATLLYLIKHDMLHKVSNSDCKEGNDLFVLQFGPSMVAGDMEKWMQNNIRAIGLMRKTKDPNPEIESILQRYRTTLRQHQSQDALVRTFDLIKDAELKEEEYIQLLVHIEQGFADRYGKSAAELIAPKSLGEMLAAMLSYKHEAIYDPYIGTASLLMDVPEDIAIYGSEINLEYRNYAYVKLALRGSVSSRSISVPGEIKEVPATCIISYPPILGTPREDRTAFEAPIRLFRENENVTELLLVVPEVFLFSDRYKDIRKSLTDDNLLERILQLPTRFFWGTSLVTSIVHLRKGRTEENEITFGNLADEAQKVGRRNEVNKSLFEGIINPLVELEENGKIVLYDVRDPQEFHYPAEIVENDYDWSCDTYAIDTNATGIPYGGETKHFVDIVERFNGERLKGWPEKAISIRNLNSPFDNPVEIAPKGTRAVGFVRITEPVLMVGYSNKCPLYFIDASEENPVFVDRREILYRCIDSLVNPMYIACIYSRTVKSFVDFDEYIYQGMLDPNRRIDKFLRKQEVGLPSFPVQLERVKEWKETYFREQLQHSNMAQYVEALKQQYIDEVRSRKHNMRPFLREIKSSVDLARLYLEKASSIDELKAKLSSLLDSIESNGEGLAEIVERLSQEDKFEEADYLDVLDELLNIAADYTKHTKLNVFVNKIADYPDVTSACDNPLTWGDYAYISTYDFRRMINAIIENARVHGFEGNDEGHNIYIKIDYEEGHFRISIKNDGLPFPERFDINTYGQRGGKAGKHAGTGDGGHQVVAIADHFGGWVEINSSKPGALEQFAEVIVYLRIADKDWDEEMDTFLETVKNNDNV